MTVREKESVTLSCRSPVVGRLTWSREKQGEGNVDILTVYGGREQKHVADPDAHYRKTGANSLYISSVSVSDAGQYSCNKEPAVNLQVTPSGNV